MNKIIELHRKFKYQGINKIFNSLKIMFIEEEDTTDEPVIINDDEEGLFVDDLIEQPYILRKNFVIL